MKDKEELQRQIDALQAELNAQSAVSPEPEHDQTQATTSTENSRTEPTMGAASQGTLADSHCDSSLDHQRLDSSPGSETQGEMGSKELVVLKYFFVFIGLSLLIVGAVFLGSKLSLTSPGGSPIPVAVVDLNSATKDALALAAKGYDPAKSAKVVLASILNRAKELQQQGYLILDKKSVFAGPVDMVIIDWKTVYAEAQANGVDLLSTMNQLAGPSPDLPLIRPQDLQQPNQAPAGQMGNPLGAMFEGAQ